MSRMGAIFLALEEVKVNHEDDLQKFIEDFKRTNGFNLSNLLEVGDEIVIQVEDIYNSKSIKLTGGNNGTQ